MKIIYSILLMMIIITFNGCSFIAKFEKAPGISIPFSKMNKDLHLYAPPEANLFTIGDDISITIENLSGKPIIISANEVSVLEKTDTEWKKIEIIDQFPNRNFQILPKEEELFGWVMLSIIPELNSKSSTILRIIVIGNLVKDEEITDQQVGGYLDITMNP